MKPRVSLVWMALLLIVVANVPLRGGTETGDGEVILLASGEYHGDEVAVVSRPGWLALYTAGEDGGPRLAPVAVRIDVTFDAVLDQEGEATGKRVSVAGGGPEPVFLLAGPHGLEPGPVTPASPSEGTFSGLDPMTISLGGDIYELGFRLGRPPSPDDAAEDAADDSWHDGALVLSHGGVEQTLADFQLWIDPDTGDVYFGSEASPQVLWAGDLDHDGRLDLYLDLTDHYNVSRPTLFLSSAAAPGELVAQVASHVSMGC